MLLMLEVGTEDLDIQNCVSSNPLRFLSVSLKALLPAPFEIFFCFCSSCSSSSSYRGCRAQNGLTALMVAARIRTLRTAQALVNADADVSHRDLNGWAALHLAADAGPAESKFL
eukprot:m.396702 g.396702  ORF g.396702 m.396702 type:complete len:114 (+) comp56413_c1_seq14:1459-1800(+)